MEFWLFLVLLVVLLVVLDWALKFIEVLLASVLLTLAMLNA